MNPLAMWMLMNSYQQASPYMNQQGGGNSGGGQNPYLQAGQMGMQALGGLIDTPEKKFGRWQTGMAKNTGDLIRWDLLGKQAVSPDMLNQMAARNRQALAPTRANMLWGASRHAGLGSGQTWNAYMQNYLPVEAGLANQNQQWATGLNVQNRNYLLSLLSGLTGA